MDGRIDAVLVWYFTDQGSRLLTPPLGVLETLP
jgi:hypothetical protein